MTVQAQWHDMTWEMSPTRIRSIGSFKQSRSLDVEKTEDSEGQPPEQTVKLNLQTLDISYEVLDVMGNKVRKEYGDWFDRLSQGIHAPLFVGGQPFGDCEYLLKDISFDPSIIDANGNFRLAKISLKFWT